MDERETMKINTLHHRRNVQRTIFAVASAAVVFVLALPPPVAAQQRYEPAAVLSASKILPPEILSGPNHRVQERVTNDGIVNIYKVDSRFGTFNAVSTAMLRLRIQEINAMAVMEQLKGTKEFGDALKESALNTWSLRRTWFFNR